MRKKATHEISDLNAFKARLVCWGAQHETALFLDGHNERYRQEPSEHDRTSFEALLAVGVKESVVLQGKSAFDDLEAFRQDHKDWMFGHLGYDLKNADEDLVSHNPDGVGFADGYFFVPHKVFLVYSDRLEVHYCHKSWSEWSDDLVAIESTIMPTHSEASAILLQPRISKDTYLETLNNIKYHIEIGDIYETNYCQEFYAEDTPLNPLVTFLSLNQYSRAPFSAFYRLGKKYALCASPERYLRKKGDNLLSEPIKGTAKRLPDPQADIKHRLQFINDEKERRENIMVTDLVRNDLSKVAAKGSVAVTALCACRTYAHVHQLVSSVACTLKTDTTVVQALRATFPMGSMTGVPKVMACALMEQFEAHKRGLYSGTIGYITPDADFDFNVVIRTLLYAADINYVSLSVGGAITSASDPEKEYLECLIKADALMSVLKGSHTA
ncbi:MAG: anthranilate synthase component I family protein [Flavobacteriaceae bacterium]|nr:anthranilate synthase component I family protein [Flavobacteriaceae bacterium]MDG1961742.1 anthranilate synthase component I family protein [Flavobacteriaceae bacterium]